MFDIKYEHLFQECDFLESALNIELITESGNSQNELDFGVFSLYNLGIIFKFKHDSGWPNIIHAESFNFGVEEDVSALWFVEQSKTSLHCFHIAILFIS